MFGDSAQGTGIFPTTVKKADGSIIENPLELEGEGGSSVNYLDVTISIRRNRLRWTLYDKKKFIFIDGKALLESPNFPWYDSKLTERSKVGIVTSEIWPMVRYSRRTDTKNDFLYSILNFFLLFGFWIMILEQAALTHITSKGFFAAIKTFQNDEGAKQHMAPSTSQSQKR